MPEDRIQCRLVLDSCCDLPLEVLENAKVDFLKFPFNMNDGEHFDDMWKSMTAKEFYDRMRKGEVSGTAQIPVSELIERFGGYGLAFSLDDFGSSYSNLSMLADLDFRSIKLDRSMVHSIATNKVSQMMVRDIAKICESRGMRLIAEGVETKAQADALIAEGCFYAQGFYFGRPMPVSEFEKKYFER